jgi:Mn-dependent DtxR family transcriptional regulator
VKSKETKEHNAAALKAKLQSADKEVDRTVALADDDKWTTIDEIAAELKLDPKTVTEMFEHEQGVIDISKGRARVRFTRPYRTLRIPISTKRRVIAEHRVA